MLKSVWNNNNFSVLKKIKVYTTMLRNILVYGHESWYSTVTSDKIFFLNKVLRRILRLNGGIGFQVKDLKK